MWKCRECDNQKYGIKTKLFKPPEKISANMMIAFHVTEKIKNCDEKLLQ